MLLIILQTDHCQIKLNVHCIPLDPFLKVATFSGPKPNIEIKNLQTDGQSVGATCNCYQISPLIFLN